MLPTTTLNGAPRHHLPPPASSFSVPAQLRRFSAMPEGRRHHYPISRIVALLRKTSSTQPIRPNARTRNAARTRRHARTLTLDISRRSVVCALVHVGPMCW